MHIRKTALNSLELWNKIPFKFCMVWYFLTETKVSVSIAKQKGQCILAPSWLARGAVCTQAYPWYLQHPAVPSTLRTCISASWGWCSAAPYLVQVIVLGKGQLFPGAGRDGTHRELGGKAGSHQAEPIPSRNQGGQRQPWCLRSDQNISLWTGVSWAEMGSWTMGRVMGHPRRGWQGFQGCQCPQGFGRLQVVFIQRGRKHCVQSTHMELTVFRTRLSKLFNSIWIFIPLPTEAFTEPRRQPVSFRILSCFHLSPNENHFYAGLFGFVESQSSLFRVCLVHELPCTEKWQAYLKNFWIVLITHCKNLKSVLRVLSCWNNTDIFFLCVSDLDYSGRKF